MQPSQLSRSLSLALCGIAVAGCSADSREPTDTRATAVASCSCKDLDPEWAMVVLTDGQREQVLKLGEATLALDPQQVVDRLDPFFSTWVSGNARVQDDDLGSFVLRLRQWPGPVLRARRRRLGGHDPALVRSAQSSRGAPQDLD